MPSTVIRNFSYDDSTRELRIVFQSGRPYLYQDVPRQIYESMQRAFSKGEFFNAHIRDHFKFVRATAAEPRLAAVKQDELFAPLANLPEGFTYQEEFLTQAQEEALIERLQELPFKEAQYKEWQARRRIVSYGGRYDFTHNELLTAPAIPQWLHPLRTQVAGWSKVEAAEFNHATIAEYSPGTQLGWHRDVPQFEQIVGVSLAGTARMRFRPYPPAEGQRATMALDIAPRSIYVMRGTARWHWQHAISPTKELRYSITFRTRVQDGP
jgi:alkylated DNA repair dioxygenase AlkB